MSAWEKYDRFMKRMDEPSVEEFFERSLILYLMSIVMSLTDDTTWTVIGWIVIVGSLLAMFGAVVTFLEGPPENKLAKAYEEGFRAGKSKAMRHMSDEPNLSLELGVNPYEAKPAKA